MTAGRMGAEGDPTTIIVYADVYTQETRSTSERELSVMMSSSDPSSPQASISTKGFDVLDDARSEKINTTPVTSQPTKPEKISGASTDADAIEEAVPIVKTTLPVPELGAKIEKNGIEMKKKRKKKKKSPDEPNDECLINCIYYSQQCCDCTIV